MTGDAGIPDLKLGAALGVALRLSRFSSKASKVSDSSTPTHSSGRAEQGYAIRSSGRLVDTPVAHTPAARPQQYQPNQ